MSAQVRALRSLPRLPTPAAIGVLLSAVVPLALVALALSAQLAFADRVLPGVRVDGIDLGGLTLSEARDRIDAAAARLQGQSVTVSAGDREWRTTYADLGVSADAEAGLARAAAFGHEGSAVTRLRAWSDALIAGVDLSLPRVATDDRLARFVAGAAQQVDRAAVDATVVVGADGVTVTPAQNGSRLPQAQVVSDALASGPVGARVVYVALETVAPEIGDGLSRPAADQAGAAYAPLAVSLGGTTVDVPAARAGSLLRIEKEAVDGIVRLKVAVDPAGLDALVADVAAKLDRPARDATLRAAANGFEVIPSQDGVSVDRDALRTALSSALFGSGDGRSITPKTAIVTPRLTTQAAKQFAGQMTLVSTYTTYFPVNPSRGTNIRLGSSRFNGLVIAPGASFSFWNNIGNVSYATGFVDSGAIIDGKSDTALGGGLCQVSTTLFNAVVRAGYQIDERGPHSYYIERYPIGLDAAVFSPGQDFRWTNDTPYPVLIRTSSSSSSVTFSLYSVPTGRVTTFSGASQANLAMPSKDQFADPAYPKGYVVRGRDVSVTRTVMANGALVRRDVFYSHYSPVWGGSATTLTVR